MCVAVGGNVSTSGGNFVGRDFVYNAHINIFFILKISHLN